MHESLVYFITALMYVVLAVSGRYRVPQPRTSPAAVVQDPAMGWRRGLLPIVLVLHALLLLRDMLGGASFSLNLGTALSLILWLTVLIYWVESHWVQIGALQNLVLPVAAISVLLPYFMSAQRVLAYAELSSFKSHLVIAMPAYGLLTVAALHAVLLLVLEKRLHKGNLPTFWGDLPPLLSLERVTFRILFVGFVLLTLTLLSGMVFSEAWFGKPFKFTHHIILGLIAWLIFGLLLLGRRFWGWRGRVAARWLLTGFGFLLLAYVGTKFVLEVLLHRY
jgi:ABC-type uncharacterized transport system permease subunit